MKKGIHSKLLSTLLTGAAMLACPMAAYADEQPDSGQSTPGTWRISTGVNYSRGDYGDVQDTKVISAPVAVKYRRGGFSLRVSAPYVHIDGPGSLLDTPQGRDAGFGDDSGVDDSGVDDSGGSSSSSGSESSSSGGGSGSGGSDSSHSGGSDDTASGSDTVAGGSTIVGPPGAASNRRNGLGDIAVTLAYSFNFADATYFDLSGRVKVPTASTLKRLGTGKVDFTLGGDLVQDIGRATVYIGGRRKFMGKPVGSTLRDTWGVGGGASYRLPGGTVLGADYDWQQSSNASRRPSSEVTGWVNFGLTRKLRMQIFASTGFTTNSADFAGGISLSYRLN